MSGLRPAARCRPAWFVVLACLPALVAAQPPPPPAPPAANAEESPRVEEAPAGSIQLRDSDGKLVWVPGVTLEEFMRIWMKDPGGPAVAAPNYSLDSLAITGRVEDDRTVCTFTLQARTTQAGWVRVPLRMGKAVLKDAPQHEGPANQVLQWEADGYVWWIKGNTEPAKVTFDALVPLTKAGDETRWSLALPRASSAAVKLETAETSLQTSLRGGEGIAAVEERGGGSQIEVVGAAGDFQLGWRKGVNTAAAPTPLLESGGEILVKVDGKSRVSSEARLKVRSFGGPVASFRVRLPPGMELVPTNPSGYTVQVIEDLPRGPNAMNMMAKAAQLVEVKLDRPSAGITEVRLVADLVPDEKRATPLEPARFEILGAVRQRGALEAVVDGDWSLQWTEDGSVRRVDTGADTASGTRLAARFEYFRQPCGLKMQVVPRPTRITVEPTYIVHIEPRHLRLEGLLKYRLRGAKASQLTIDPANWQLQRVGPESLVELDLQSPAGGGASFTLLGAAAAPGEFEVRFEARRAIAEGDEDFSFELPRPKGDIISPAMIVIQPADNMEVLPEPDALQGLAADSLPSQFALPVRQQPPLVYREVGGAELTRFVGVARKQSGRVTASATATVHVDRTRLEVEQRLSYLVQYEPQRAFDVLVAGGPAAALQAFDEKEQPLPLVRVDPDDAEAPTPEGQTRYRMEAPAPLLGLHDFVLRQTIDVPPSTNIARPVVEIPLVRPVAEAGTSGGGTRFVVKQADDLQLEPAAAANALRWERVGNREFRGVLPTEATSLGLRITPLDRPRSPGTVVSRVFLQTWLTASEREDRAALRLITSDPKIRLRLPQGADAEHVLAALDGDKIEPAGLTDLGEVVIDIPPEKRGRDAVLELWYGFTIGRTVKQRLWTSVDPPAVSGVSIVRQVMWHVVTPADEQLLSDPAGFVPEMNWLWQGAFFGRRAALSQDSLESWVGASKQDPLPEAGNHYLFSSFGRSQSLELPLVRRRWLMLIVSGFALVCGLALVHWPALRRPGLMTAAGVTVLGLALALPEPAMLVGQAAVLGAVAVISGWILRRMLVGPSRVPTVDLTRRLRADRSGREPSKSSARVPSPATTATAPLGFLPEHRS